MGGFETGDLFWHVLDPIMQSFFKSFGIIMTRLFIRILD